MAFNIEEMNVVLREQGMHIVPIDKSQGKDERIKGAVSALNAINKLTRVQKREALELAIKMLAKA